MRFADIPDPLATEPGRNHASMAVLPGEVAGVRAQGISGRPTPLL
jgi:hypothetical protein